ncbi:serine hydrolase domain-containing protein [Streptomyces sp. MST-110588]|uniref:serine hydrolase domain-containing protein n=1 Tax=Streptomyces sp. MST-110588 TaxID=2833628 RepID=UPI001F5D6704|nr:serine hydrolase domain-containing protein [Streptomyces sp. MST-110588]UNO44013.1 beta-lactamase family protein [Streptomyces sp. MST-110588]
MPEKGLSKEGLRRMHDILAGHIESGAAPGLVAMVTRGGDTHVEIMGTLREGGGAPVRRDTIFRLASVTKPVTAAATMILVDECRLRLDDPVDDWLPELAGRRVLKRFDGPLEETVPARRSITVRDLLTFTFGFGMTVAPGGAAVAPIMEAMSTLGSGSGGPDPKPDPDTWMRRLGELPLMYQPGERWLYHTGSDVLGVLVARVSGRPFEAFLRERVFEPLGMKDTGFHVPEHKIHRLPTSYAHDQQTGDLVVYDEPTGGSWSRPPAFPAGGDGLASTADDYTAFQQMLLNKGTYGKERILSRAAVELMTSDQLTPRQRAGKDAFFGSEGGAGFGGQGGFGFGMAVRTHRCDYPSVGQFGWDGGLGTSAYADPAQGLTGILLTQAAMDAPTSLHLNQDFWTTAYQAIED